MNKILSFILAGLLFATTACEESEFTERYADPSKISETSVEKQYTGIMYTNRNWVLPAYGNYFVTLRTSINRYTQSVGWPFESGNYVPGSAGSQDLWFNYYNTLAQFRELERIYASRPTAEQNDKKVFLITAKIYLYDYTQRLVDIYGAIPFTEAGMLSANNGDYASSIAKFDSPESIYTLMLDDLKLIASELNTINANPGFQNYQKAFQTADIVNKGSLDLWKRYCNSLRLRMLNRVSAAPAFQARAKTEMGEILTNAGTFPVVETNEQNIQMNVYDVNTDINSKGFQDGIASGGGDWFGNTASKKMIDHMNTNADPRLKIIFEPGQNAKGVYAGIDPLATSSVQTAQYQAGTVAIYNRFTLSHNQFFPGVIINAAQVNLIKAEYYLNQGNDALAKTAYETAIAQSVNFYNSILAITNATGITNAAKPVPAQPASITQYIAGSGVSWAAATTPAEKLNRIATQKWLHFNIVQAYENWAEVRRLDMPALQFQTDNANNQTLPPVRWTYPGNEVTYNPINYAAVRDNDKLTQKLFWDVK
ncbi:SusD/RagB family nutrient-binding outer membrane lipoprotein [Dyadobacter crusticola]|uniref:SusD/RagB family nutrient-binding outer membrane lipoprotein n=1 Tax=Dyadobacter crusticola TaxID=292407 RepID=UPI0004E10CC4|nr:SusD/RagB family nutrient-binding outer membrane lipoprotein [Dyadobacter crusticola]